MQPVPVSSLLLNLGILVIVIPFLVQLSWYLWLNYIQIQFLRSIKWVLLEVKPPKDVFKSPQAMELVINALYQTGGTGTWFDRLWKGNLRNYFALEIVSLEGDIHFYIRTSNKFQKLIESQVYAQYPQAEVIPVTDYVDSIPDFSKDGPIGLWGCNLDFTKADPFPIKTYVDYGLDKAVGSLEEAQRIDPITPTLEFMGSIGAGEYMMMQIIVRAVTDRFEVKKGDVVEKNKKWPDLAKSAIKELNALLNEKDAEGKVTVRKATRGEGDVVNAIERKANKLGFDAGIRLLYVAENARFDANRISGVTGMVRQYNTNDYNGFKPKDATSFDFPWQDIFGTKIAKKKKDMLDDYKARDYFYGGFNFKKLSSYFQYPGISGSKPIVLCTEELATLFHLPGRVAETPTFGRIEATKGEPPANLPI